MLGGFRLWYKMIQGMKSYNNKTITLKNKNKKRNNCQDKMNKKIPYDLYVFIVEWRFVRKKTMKKL